MNTATQTKTLDVIMDLEPKASHPLVDRRPTSSMEVTPVTILQMAVERGADIDQLGTLLELQVRWEQNEAKKAFTAAMAKFKENPPEIIKDKLVGYENRDGTFTGYKHATLAAVCEGAISGLAAVGISHKWDVRQDGGAIAVTCVLTHRMGHSESVQISAAADTSGKKNAIQAVASSITYLQRYTLLSATGLATQDQDNDGADHKDPKPDWADDHFKNIAAAKTEHELKSFWSAAAAICRRKGDEGRAPYDELKAEVVKRGEELGATGAAS